MRIRILLLGLLLGFSLPASHARAAQSAAPAAKAAYAAPAVPAQKLRLPGLPNLGRVNDRLYRGAQPKEEGWAELKKLGVEVVVNLRERSVGTERERERVEKLGMKYVSLPWSGMDDPDNRQMAEFLSLLRAERGRKVFVHCRRGAERTGVMVAAYRMLEEKWTPEQALNEMEAFGFRGFWFRHLKKYVRSFPSLLQSDPALKPLAQAQ